MSTSTEKKSKRDYEVGYGKPPKHTRFRPGMSGNPDGLRKRPKADSLQEAIAMKLAEPLPRAAKVKGAPRDTRQLMIRNLVMRAANGDRKALIDLIRVRQEAASPPVVKIRMVAFAEASQKKDASKLTEAFFAQQDVKRAELRQQQRGALDTMGGLIDFELARRVRATKGDRSVRVSMQDVIATRFASDAATGDGGIIRLLQDINPEKKRFTPPTTYTFVARPTEAELGAQDQASRDADEKFKTYCKDRWGDDWEEAYEQGRSRR